MTHQALLDREPPALWEEVYRLAFDVAPSGMFVLDADATILVLNAKAAEIFGYPPAGA